MIFRLTKGTGCTGLAPFDITTKPFWQVPKSKIIKYAQNNHLEWREDSSNNDLTLERNCIRHNILPQLRKITPNLEKVFVAQSQTFKETQAFLDQSIATLNPDIFKENKIKLTEFQTLSPILQKEFLRKIATKTPSLPDLKDALKWLLNAPKGNSKKLLGELQLRIQNQHITW